MVQVFYTFNKFLKIFCKIFSWLLIKFLFSYLPPPHWFSSLSDDGVTFVFCSSQDVIKSKILNEKSKIRRLHLVYCIVLLKNLVNLSEQHLQGSPIFVRLVAHNCKLRKNRTSLQMFSCKFYETFQNNFLISSTSGRLLLKKFD